MYVWFLLVPQLTSLIFIICICIYQLIMVKNIELLCGTVGYYRSFGLANTCMCIRGVELLLMGLFFFFFLKKYILEAEVDVLGILHILSS